MVFNADVIHGFGASLLQKNFDGVVESPPCHYEWWELCCDRHPFVAIAAPRGHAKSTAITLTYTLAAVLFRQRSYVILVSDTVSQSVQFLGDIKNQLIGNEQIKSLFKIKEFVKDSEDDCIVLCEDGHMFRLQAKGSEQKVRGLKWHNKRPDLIVCDDLENDEIVLNKERREKFKRWFNGALLPCRSANGIVRYVGTILHTDSMLENLMPKEWDKKTVVEPLKTHRIGRHGWLSVKYKAHDETFEHVLWPQRAAQAASNQGIPGGAEGFFRWLRQGFIDQGIPDVYSQEYLNTPIDESMSYLRRGDFVPMTEQDKERNMRFYITGDLAISDKETADYSVFVVAGVDENKMVHIRHVIRDRLDGREIVDCILSLERVYKPEAIGIEEMQVSQAIGPFLREEMIKTNTFPNLHPLKHMGKDKMARGRSIQARMRARGVRFDKGGDWYQTFENECVQFPRARNDDQFDAFAYMGMLLDIMIEAPTDKEIEEELYQDEYDRLFGDTGRSSVTGY